MARVACSAGSWPAWRTESGRGGHGVMCAAMWQWKSQFPARVGVQRIAIVAPTGISSVTTTCSAPAA